MSREWAGAELLTRRTALAAAARPADTNKEPHSVEIQQEPAQWPSVSERDGKDFVLLLLAGARRHPGRGKSQNTFFCSLRAKQMLLYMEAVYKVVWLCCNRGTHGLKSEPQVCFRCSHAVFFFHRMGPCVIMACQLASVLVFHYKEITLLSPLVI